ncbi:MAG: NADH-quinone oxidoreductase subunit NuoK [Cytophagales bacterium]|nr:NADH-quinone oxidoreductase subunit NuoK [Cytophagales bacterium]
MSGTELIQPMLALGALLFSLGLFMVISKRNAVMILMGVELLLNASTVNLVAFGLGDGPLLKGQVFALFVVVVAAAETAVALALVIQVYHHFRSANLDDANELTEPKARP